MQFMKMINTRGIIMSIGHLTEVLNDLVLIHEKTLDLSLRKTELIKAGEIDNLSKIIMDERKYLQQVTQLEQKRQQVTEVIYEKYGISSEERTISELLEHLEDESIGKQLEQSVVKLVENIVKLKQNEQLNNDLIQQSMQFVQLSLDMLQPSVQNINYDDRSTGKDVARKQSVFDSKA